MRLLMKSARTWRNMKFLLRHCWRGARNSQQQVANHRNQTTTCQQAPFSLHTIIYLRAERWGAIVPGSHPQKRLKTRRGVRHPARSPGGIASKDRHFAFFDFDDAGVPYLV